MPLLEGSVLPRGRVTAARIGRDELRVPGAGLGVLAGTVGGAAAVERRTISLG